VPDPLVQSLMRRNYLLQDPHKIGLELDSQYELQNPSIRAETVILN
jgi:hypothetical protein